MKNAYAIDSISRQLVKTVEQIGELARGIQDTEQGIGDVDDIYAEILLDELEHIQMLTLKLTELITQEPPEANADEGEGSVFAAGDLDDDGKTDNESEGDK